MEWVKRRIYFSSCVGLCHKAKSRKLDRVKRTLLKLDASARRKEGRKGYPRENGNAMFDSRLLKREPDPALLQPRGNIEVDTPILDFNMYLERAS
jgi:hypothetical protein